MSKYSRIEFLIENLLKLQFKAPKIKEQRPPKHKSGYNETVDPGRYIKRSFTPDHPWIACMGEDFENLDDRLLTTSSDYLVVEPAKMIGKEFEVYMFSNLSFHWAKLAKTEARYIRPLSLPFAKDIYEYHVRSISMSQKETYDKTAIGINGMKGTPLMLQNNPLRSDIDNLLVLSSVKEDLYRIGVFHVKITNTTTGGGIRLAVDYDEVKEMFRHRDTPRTERGNKKPIIHWVANHLRKKRNTKKVEHSQVKRHIRGVERFEIDEFAIEIEQPELTYKDFMAA